jgi:hypothetical protein
MAKNFAEQFPLFQVKTPVFPAVCAAGHWGFMRSFWSENASKIQL